MLKAQKKGRAKTNSKFAIESSCKNKQAGNNGYVGVIENIRPSDDNSHQSFTIALDRGGSCVRNKRFIKHLRNTTTDAEENDAPDHSDGPHRNTRSRTRSE